MLEKAIKFATEAHTGQVRKRTGIPYITHPIAVMESCARLGYHEICQVAAVLHDTVEDTPVTLQQIEEEFGDDVAEVVALVTNGNEQLKRLAEADFISGQFALFVKIEDIIHNTQDSDKLYVAKKWYQINQWVKITRTNPKCVQLRMQIIKERL